MPNIKDCSCIHGTFGKQCEGISLSSHVIKVIPLIRNPTFCWHWNPESKEWNAESKEWNPEPKEGNPESKEGNPEYKE